MLLARPFEPDRMRPYAAWTDALAAVPRDDIPAELSADLASLRPELGPRSDGIDQPRLFDAAARLVRALADPVVALVIDDFHWCDDASAAVVHALARLDDPGVVVALAARPGELADTPGPLRVWRSLERQGRLRELALGPLDADDLTALVAAACADVDAGAVVAACGGNPLYAVELARAGGGGPGGSATLDRLLADRLERLDGVARDLVGWAAAVGRTFRPELVCAAAEASGAEADEALAALERHGLIVPVSDDAYRFAHDLVRDAAYQRLSGPRRRLVHRHLARVLAAGGGDRADEIAYHAGLGGDDDRAAEACLAAAHRALRLGAMDDALARVERGLAHAARLDGERRLRLVVELRRAQVFCVEGGDAELDRALETAVIEAEAAGLADVVASGHFALAVLCSTSVDTERAHRNLREAAEAARAASAPTELFHLANAAWCVAWLQRDLGEAEALLAEASAIARNQRRGQADPDVDLAVGIVSRHRGDHGRARTALVRAALRTHAAGDSWREFNALIELAMMDVEEGRFADAIARAPALTTASSRLIAGSEPAVGRAVIAVARYGAGAAGAAAELDAGVDELRRLDALRPIAWVQAMAADLALAGGRVDEAGARAAEARRAAEILGLQFDRAAATAVLARVLAARGDVGGASALLASVEAITTSVPAGRARRMWAAAAHAVAAGGGRAASTLDPTLATTPRGDAGVSEVSHGPHRG